MACRRGGTYVVQSDLHFTVKLDLYDMRQTWQRLAGNYVGL